jgi:energy-converting hydrogenase Eha subunit H
LFPQTESKQYSDPQEAFEKSMKQYIIFIVKKTPCVQDLTEYISNMESRKEFSKNLIYFHNQQKIEQMMSYFLGVAWATSVVINIALIVSGNTIDLFDHHTYLPLIGFTFIGPQIFSVCEAWANALMISLFVSLQFEDYNKYLMRRRDVRQMQKELSR